MMITQKRNPQNKDIWQLIYYKHTLRIIYYIWGRQEKWFKKKIFFTLIGVSLILIGFILLLEGQLKISTKNFLEINELIEESDNLKILNIEVKIKNIIAR